jgi:hypothetical protein
MNNSAAETAGYLNLTTPPLMGGDKGEGDNNGSNHPHLTSPIKGEELYGNPVARPQGITS